MDSRNSPVTFTVSEVCGWLKLPPSTRDGWVKKSLVRYIETSHPDRLAIVEMFVAFTLNAALGVDKAQKAWTRVQADVLSSVDEMADHLYVVWLETPPSVALVRTDEELLNVVKSEARQLVVIDLAPTIRKAIDTISFHEQAAWAEQSAQQAAKTRKGKSGRGRRPGRTA